MKKEGGGAVRHPFGMHGMYKAEIIDMLCDVGKERADPATGFTVLLEIPKRFEKFPLGFFAEGVFADTHEIERLPVAFDKLGLVIEGVNMRGPSSHEEKDDPFSASW